MSAYYPYQYDDPAMAADPYASDVDPAQFGFWWPGWGWWGRFRRPFWRPWFPWWGWRRPWWGWGWGWGPGPFMMDDGMQAAPPGAAVPQVGMNQAVTALTVQPRASGAPNPVSEWAPKT